METWLQSFLYPLVISQFAIEHGHRNSEFSHYIVILNMVIFYSYVTVYQRVICFEHIPQGDSTTRVPLVILTLHNQEEKWLQYMW